MKNTKVILGIIAFVSTFIFSAGLVRILFPAPVVPIYQSRSQYRSQMASDIEDFIRRDIRNGQSRNRQIRYQSDFDRSVVSADEADSVMDYWETSSNMRATSFPSDFQKAWRKHMQAWRNYADFLAERKGEKVNPDEFSVEENRYNADINRTWEDVLRIGRNYGAEVW